MVDGLNRCRVLGPRPEWDNHDLWSKLNDLLQALSSVGLSFHHVLSHLNPGRTETPLEDWIATHNGHVDTLAAVANSCRGEIFAAMYQRAREYHEQKVAELRALRSIYFNIAQQDQGRRPQAWWDTDLEIPPVAPPVQWEDRMGHITDSVSVAWHARLRMQPGPLPWEFARDICNFVFSQDLQSLEACYVSFLELVMMYIDGDICYPMTGPEGQWISSVGSRFAPLPPTVAGRLGLVRRAAKFAFEALGIGDFVVAGLDRSDVGIGFRVDGVRMGCDCPLLQQARDSLLDFTYGRRVGSAQALARPLR